MPFKPNYRFNRAERTRSKEAKKIEKLEAQVARREANCNAPTEAHDLASEGPFYLKGTALEPS